MKKERIKVRFKIQKKDAMFGGVSGYQFVGFVRGLAKAGMEICVNNTIESESTKSHYVVDIFMEENHFEFVKGQAGSYGVIVEKMP